jgi:hypothetical protein
VATSIGTKQAQLNGTGFVKVSGTTVSYDNSTYYLASNPNGYITGISFANVSAKPTTIAGYGITDSLVYTTSTYSNPSWITALAWSKITGAPAFITGYTETDTLATVTGRGASTSTAVTFSGGASISNLLINGAPSIAESSLALGAMGTTEGGQLTLNKATSHTFAAHLDVWQDVFRVLYGTNTATSGVALSVNLSTRQLILPQYTTSSTFTGTAAGVLAFDSSGNIITIAVPGGAVSSVSGGTGVSVNSTTGAVTVSIGQSVATNASPTFDQVITNNNGNGTNFRIGDDVWIGDINAANTFRVQGLQDATQGYIVFGNSNATALGRSGTGALTYGGNTIYHAGNLTNLNQLTNGPGYLTGTGADTRVAVWSGTGTLSGTDAFTYTSPTLAIGLSAASNQTDYKVVIQRHGTLANPGTWTDSNGLQVVDYASDGPSAGFIATGLVSIELPRIATTDTYAGNAVAFRVATDNMTVLAVKGNGTIHLGQNGSSDTGDRLQVSGSAKFTSNVITDSLFRSNVGIYQIWQGGTFRGGLYNYASASGSGTDYSPTLTSETDLHFTTGGSVTKKLTISSSGAATFSSTITATKLLLNDGDPKITFTPSAYSGSYRTILGTRSSAEGVLQLGNNGGNFIVAGNTGVGGALYFYVNATSDFIAGANGTLALTLAANAAATFAGTITATNFSGSSSGTNTGDQTLSGLNGAPNAGSFGDANAITTGGFFAAFNPSNIPSGQSSGDWGVLSQPLWTSNSSGERYTLQFASNLDNNANIFVRKFRFNGSVLQSAWYTLVNSANISSYAVTSLTDTLATVTARGASTSTALSLGQVSMSNRLAVGASDQSYASVFVGGAITTGTSQYAFLSDPQLAGTDNYALLANARIKANTAVTNTFGVYIPSAEKLSGASIVNNYALYIANQTSGSSTNYSIYSSGGLNYFGGAFSINNTLTIGAHQALKPSGFGYDQNSYKVLIVGQPETNSYKSLAFGVDVSGNPSGAFSGWGQEYVWKNAASFITPNSGNNGYNTLLSWSSSGQVTIPNLVASNLTLGNTVVIGSWNSATTLQFQSASNSVGRINFYDANDTEGVYIRNIGTSFGGDLRFGARWDDDEDKIFFNLRQSSAGGGYDARFGINIDPTETFHVASNGITAGAPSKGWPVYDAELDTQARRFMFQTAGNNGVAAAGQGATVALVLGQYYDSRVVITPQSNGGASPGDQGTGHGKDLMIKGGTSDNGVGYKGGRLYLNGGMGYTSGGYNGNFGTVKIQSYGGVVNIGEITGETRRLNVAYSIGIRANLTGTEQEIIRMGNTGSGVNDGYLALLDSNNTKVLLGANASRSGDNFINNGGNFGINTDVPTNKLEVFSGSTTADALTLSFTTGADNRYTGIFFKGGPFPYARIVAGTSNYGPDQGFISFYTNFNPSGAAGTSGWCLERVRINPNGSIVATGDITAFGSPSDIRLKDIKEVVPNALQSILQLNAYRFDWKEVNHLTKIKEDIGVIAQEVEKVLPELARTNDDGTMSVRYQGLTAVLIEAIKEQQTQIESQKSEIEELKDLVKQLINR